jgi:hypothetical protein
VVSEKKVKEIRQKVKYINGSEICKLTDNEIYMRLKHNRRCNIGTELALECRSRRVLYQKTTAQMRSLNLCNKKWNLEIISKATRCPPERLRHSTACFSDSLQEQFIRCQADSCHSQPSDSLQVLEISTVNTSVRYLTCIHRDLNGSKAPEGVKISRKLRIF